MVTQLDEDAEELEGPHPPPVTSFHTNSGFQGPQTPGILGPQNPGLVPFLRKWAHPGLSLSNDTRPRFRSPWLPTVNELENLRVKRVDYDDLMGDQCDVQGIDWTQLGVTRREARERRLNTYTNFVNVDGSDAFNVCVTALISPHLFIYTHIHILHEMLTGYLLAAEPLGQDASTERELL